MVSRGKEERFLHAVDFLARAGAVLTETGEAGTTKAAGADAGGRRDLLTIEIHANWAHSQKAQTLWDARSKALDHPGLDDREAGSL